MKLSFDYSRMTEELALAAQKANLLEQAHAKVQQEKTAGQLGFVRLPYQKEELTPILALAEAVRKEFSSLVVIGIGGSDLGTRAVHRALNHQFYNSRVKNAPKLYFLGDTTDPVAIEEVLEVVDLKTTAFAVVSKSGNTIEQMSVFIYIRQLIIEQGGEAAAQKQIIILTDEKNGTLREIVEQDGYRSLIVPADVGGRFSVLSCVSLFPLAVVGVDIHKLLAGAAEIDQYDNQVEVGDNQAATYAFLQYLAYQEGRSTSVFMPYSYSLREVGFWFRQLWAESLGKKDSLDGHTINVGPTPIAALGPTDQHSQVQLYMEGPAGKVFTFVTVTKPKVDMVLPEAYPDKEGVAYLKGHHFNEILLAEQLSTAHALAKAGRPSCTISLETLDEESLGQLLYFFELAVTYAGALFNINTFDQPGVEIGKNYMYGILGRQGYDEWHV